MKQEATQRGIGPIVTSLNRIQWTGKFRALLPASAGPAIFVHVTGECLYGASHIRQRAQPNQILLNGSALNCLRQGFDDAPGELLQYPIPPDLLLSTTTPLLSTPLNAQRACIERSSKLFPQQNYRDNPVMEWHVQRLLAMPGGQSAPALLEAEIRVRQTALSMIEGILNPAEARRRSVEQQIQHLDALARSRAVMAAQLANPKFTLSDAADAAALSPAHFGLLFRVLTGITPHQYLTRVRLEHARILLLHSEMPISDICYESGYEHLSHFAAMFRRVYGASPSVWREEKISTPRRFAVALNVLAEVTPNRISRSLPVYVRRGSAAYLMHLALMNRGSCDRVALDAILPFLRRPERRNSAVKLVGVICEGTGAKGVEAIHRVFADADAGMDDAPLALGEAVRGRSFAEIADALDGYLRGPLLSVRRNAARAIAWALRDTADERILQWKPYLFRTGDGLLDNAGVVSLGFAFRGSAHKQVAAMLDGCLTEGLQQDSHDHALSPACLCNSSLGLALVYRGSPTVSDAANAISKLLSSPVQDNVHDGVMSLCRLYAGAAPNGLETLLKHVPEGRFSPLLMLFDGASQQACGAIGALWSSPSPMLRRTMALACGLVYQGTGDSYARGLLEDNIRRGAPKLKGDSILALGLVDHASKREEVFRLAQQTVRPSQPYQTRSALLAVGLVLQGSGHTDAIEWAVSFAGDSNRYVSAAAIWCLGLLGQGSENRNLAARIIELSRGNSRLRNDADQALLMLEFGTHTLDLLGRWYGRLPGGEYASSFNLVMRCFARRPGSHWDVDEPFYVG